MQVSFLKGHHVDCTTLDVCRSIMYISIFFAVLDKTCSLKIVFCSKNPNVTFFN